MGIRSHIDAGAQVTRSVLLGADCYVRTIRSRLRADFQQSASGATPCSIASSSTRTPGSVDGARLVNEAGIQDADGDGYYIRNGIIIVPKGGIVPEGAVV